MLKTVKKAHQHQSLIEVIHAHFTVFSIVALGAIVIASAFPVVNSIFSAKAAITTLTSREETYAAEDSGLAASKQYPGIYWWNRDGGPATADKPRDAVFALKVDANGNLAPVQGTNKSPFFMISGHTNQNWEDVAIDDSGNLWVGDIGDNNCSRTNQAIIKFREPNPTVSSTLTSIAKYTINFPDNAPGNNPNTGLPCTSWNSEAMFWLEGKMYIFAKGSNSPVYRADIPSGTSGTINLVRIGQLAGGISNISASSASDDYSRFMVESHAQMNVYTTTNTNLRGEAWVRDIISRAPKFTSNFNTGTTANPSVEGGAFKRGSYDLAFVSEGKSFYYAKPAAYGDTGTPPPVTPPTISSFVASPSTITSGSTSTLTWASADAVNCSVTPGGPTNTTATSWQTPALTANTVYTLTCRNSAGTAVTRQATVTVNAAPPSDTTRPTVSITGFTPGQTVTGTITINVTAADNVAVTKVNIFYDGTNVIRMGTSQGTYGWGSRFDTRLVGDGNHTISAIAYDAANNASTISQVVLDVDNVTSPPPAPTIETFTANPSTITAGNRSTLSWTTTNVADCSVTPNGSTNTTTTSWQTPTLSTVGTVTYTLSCRNSAGTAVTRQATVTVNAALTPPSSVVLSASKSSVLTGSSVSLSWTSNGGTSCILNPGNFTLTGSGNAKTISNMTATTTYTVACSNTAGSTTSNAVTVKVTQPQDPPVPVPAPVINSFAPKNASILSGESTSLIWSTSNVATSGCALTPSPLTSAGANSQWTTPILTKSTSYTLSCKNSENVMVSASTSVIVNSQPAPRPPDPVVPKTPDPVDQSAPDVENIVDVTTGSTVQDAQVDDVVSQGGLVTLDASNNTDDARVGQIEKVEYYNGDVLIATVTDAPYALDTGVLGIGTYTITQRTYFTDGSTAEASQLLTVGEPDVPASAPLSKIGGAGLAASVLVAVLAAAFGLYRFFMWRSNRLIAARHSHIEVPKTPEKARAAQLAAFLDKRDVAAPGAVIEPRKHKD